uniref:Uncharacterized protein n=1 Tax=Anguilla anguilla TaxID=7936 RepID=A0A0E9RPY6_ANGAN
MKSLPVQLTNVKFHENILRHVLVFV